jgi:hypothetical protein
VLYQTKWVFYQTKCQKRFSCALPNKVMCFTKQNTNNLTRREIQNLFSQKTKAKPQGPQKGDKSTKSRPRIWNCIQNNENFGLPHKMKDTKFVFTKPLSKFPPDQNKPTNDVINLNRQRLCRQRFGCVLPNKVSVLPNKVSKTLQLCFTKQSDVFYQTKYK